MSNDDNIEDKIVGGNGNTVENYQYQLSLRVNGVHHCGGILLSKTGALTAASCLEPNAPPSQYSIKIGSGCRTDTKPDSRAAFRNVSRFIRHPEYKRSTFENDIALLHWNFPLSYYSTVRPVDLPHPKYVIPYGKLALTSGWGMVIENGKKVFVDRIQDLEIPLVNNTVCNRAHHGRVTAGMVCAGYPEGGRSPCTGDTGGPLVDRIRRKSILVGVVSWGGDCGSSKAPSVFTNVQHYLAWIRANI